MENLKEEALALHRVQPGKMAMHPTVPLDSAHDLSLAYSPGVAEPCLAIKADPDAIYEYTNKGNTVAVVTNGTAVLGLGNIGAGAGLPVMEGKSILFKGFAGVDSFPICLDSTDVDEIVRAVEMMAPTFGGVNLEDIKAPECFEIESRLKEKVDIPVFHDDQHGTATVMVAALINALKLTGRDFKDTKFVINGAGAAGQAITRLIERMGGKDIILCDRKGAIYEGRKEDMNPYKDRIAKVTNRDKVHGSLADVIKGADVFVGVSVAGCVTKEMVRSMKKDPIIFAMANPVPEILPEDAKEAGAAIVATGRSDYPNQVNNLLIFPGLFRGALDVRAKTIDDDMLIGAAEALAALITPERLDADHIIMSPLDKSVAPAVAAAVAKAAIASGAARRKVSPEEVAKHTEELLAKG